jgi:hypothetical protein
MTQSTEHRHTNRLIHATSPYLLQHAHNPVDWHEWGPEALARAREEDKPIFLSVGYSACHWCHVMERESFENETIAAFLNEHFISIKVDREERPDIDEIYMAAVQMLTGSGGWPMTVFITHDGRPFYGGTYFPPDDRWGRAGFMTVLQAIHHAWANEREKIDANAEALTRAIGEMTRRDPAAADPGGLTRDSIAGATRQLTERYDAHWGGFGGAPKFPPSMALNLLLREHRRVGDPKLLEMVETTLDRMARGGMYDQLGGGFHRYSTDERWLAPHFEKMLYDNALLAQVYLDAWLATGRAFYLRIARQTLDYALAEMTSPEGGFYSAQDADSEGIEGKYFIWTPERTHAILDAAFGAEEAQLFCEFHDIRPGGNWHEGGGASILNVPVPLETFAAQRGVDPALLRDRLDAMRVKMFEARRQRVPPLTDDKVLIAWNGMMIGAMARGGQATGDERYTRAAERAADFILTTMRREDGDLLRAARGGEAGSIGAFLDDYAHLINGLIDLYETTFDEGRLESAAQLTERMLKKFSDGEAATQGPLYTTDGDDASVLVRMRDVYDGATPSGNSAAVHALQRLGRLLDREPWREAAERVLAAVQPEMQRQPGGFHHLLCALNDRLDAPPEIVIVGDASDPRTRALLEIAWGAYLPGRSLALGGGDAGTSPTVALLRDKRAVDGKPTAYVCRGMVCGAPAQTPEALREQLRR